MTSMVKSRAEGEEFVMNQGSITATDGLEITMHHSEEGVIVGLRGRVDISSSPAFRDRLMGIIRADSPKDVIVDLTEVSYVESSGIATLIEGLKVAHKQQKTLCLRGLQAGVLHLFQATGISALFKNSCGSATSLQKVS